VEDPDPAVGQRVDGAEVALSTTSVGEVIRVSPRRMLERAERPLEAGIGGPWLRAVRAATIRRLPQALVIGDVPAAFFRALALSERVGSSPNSPRILAHVGVVNPHSASRRSRALQATFFKQIREKDLRVCQFPSTLTDTRGTIRKPANW
jgi:hypothetical protein